MSFRLLRRVVSRPFLAVPVGSLAIASAGSGASPVVPAAVVSGPACSPAAVLLVLRSLVLLLLLRWGCARLSLAVGSAWLRLGLT